MNEYPDINEHLKAKAAHRRALAALPFEQKVEMAFKLAERRALLSAARPDDAPPARKKSGRGARTRRRLR